MVPGDNVALASKVIGNGSEEGTPPVIRVVSVADDDAYWLCDLASMVIHRQS